MCRILRLLSLLFVPACGVRAAPVPAPDPTDTTILQVCEGIGRLFQTSPDAIWPGFDMTARPLVVYRANKWALLVGHGGEAPGFDTYPADWPDLGVPARWHSGTIEGLAGQLVFDFPVGDRKGVAIGVPDDLSEAPGAGSTPVEALLLGYLVHETFHQFQNEYFGTVESPAEERYPVLDAENSALAALEMRALMDALGAAENADMQRSAHFARHFVAVRSERWKRADPFVEPFERAQELREGTAKYVEVCAIARASALEYRARVRAEKPLPSILAGLSAPRMLRTAFEERLTDGAITPDDMPRNRDYPVAATQCLLLDALGVDWKAAAQKAAPDFSYVEWLRQRLAMDETDLQRSLAEAKEHYDYERIAAATAAQIEKYRTGFAEALAAFEGQTGPRIEVKIGTNGLGRSRTSLTRKWLMDDGRRSLCAHYQVYVLTRPGIRLEIRDSGVLELDDWDARLRTAVSFARSEPEVAINGEALALEEGRRYGFSQIRLRAENVTLDCSKPGTVQRSGPRWRIDLSPAPRP